MSDQPVPAIEPTPKKLWVKAGIVAGIFLLATFTPKRGEFAPTGDVRPARDICAGFRDLRELSDSASEYRKRIFRDCANLNTPRP